MTGGQAVQAVHARFPDKLLAYNCSPSFAWRKNLSQAKIESFQHELADMCYRFQLITLAGFHSLQRCNLRAGGRLRPPA